MRAILRKASPKRQCSIQSLYLVVYFGHLLAFEMVQHVRFRVTDIDRVERSLGPVTAVVAGLREHRAFQ